MIETKRYTSGRFAVANLSASIDLKLRDTPRSRNLLAKALRNALQASPLRSVPHDVSAQRSVIGAGFAGMAVVRELRDSDAEVTFEIKACHEQTRQESQS